MLQKGIKDVFERSFNIKLERYAKRVAMLHDMSTIQGKEKK